MAWKLLFATFIFSAGLAHAIEFDSSVPADVKAATLADLDAIGGMAGQKTSPLHSTLFGHLDGRLYSQWFADRVHTFGYDPGGMGGAIAYNNSMSEPYNMMVTDYFVKGNLPQVARLVVLFHEARHSEEKQDYWPHVTCPDPFNDANGNPVKSIFSGLPIAGKQGCDDSIDGAYGSSVILMSNIHRFCENCTDKVKMDAGLYADDQTERVIVSSAHDQLTKDATETAP